MTYSYTFFIEIPMENAYFRFDPMGFGICSDECCKQTEVLIDVACAQRLSVCQVWN